MSKKEFKPPTDVSQWWRAPCCSPGTADKTKTCGFCGENVIDCALEATPIVNEKHLQPGDGDVRSEGCGGSGFWCLGCKRFWAQDCCGNCDYEGHQCSDGSSLSVVEGFVTCPCGHKLMREQPDR